MGQDSLLWHLMSWILIFSLNCWLRGLGKCRGGAVWSHYLGTFLRPLLSRNFLSKTARSQPRLTWDDRWKIPTSSDSRIQKRASFSLTDETFPQSSNSWFSITVQDVLGKRLGHRDYLFMKCNFTLFYWNRKRPHISIAYEKKQVVCFLNAQRKKYTFFIFSTSFSANELL